MRIKHQSDSTRSDVGTVIGKYCSHIYIRLASDVLYSTCSLSPHGVRLVTRERTLSQLTQIAAGYVATPINEALTSLELSQSLVRSSWP
jgi:hypothetical protein